MDMLHDKAQVPHAAGKQQDGKALCTVLEGEGGYF